MKIVRPNEAIAFHKLIVSSVFDRDPAAGWGEKPKASPFSKDRTDGWLKN